jgi:FMN phosphatase YigB (HAD superfamily)
VSARLRGVLLDFGGTLDSEGLHWSTQFALAFAAAKLSVPRSALDQAFLAADRALEQLAEVETLGYRAHVEEQARLMLRALGLPPESAPLVADAFEQRARGYLRQNLALLEGSRQRFRFGLVSNFTENLSRILEETGLAPLLQAVLCSARVGLRKPDPAIFGAALDALGLPPEQVAMIGDSLASDIVPAKQLGITTIWLRGDQQFTAGDQRAADHVVGSLAEALRLCEREGR